MVVLDGRTLTIRLLLALLDFPLTTNLLVPHSLESSIFGLLRRYKAVVLVHQAAGWTSLEMKLDVLGHGVECVSGGGGDAGWSVVPLIVNGSNDVGLLVEKLLALLGAEVAAGLLERHATELETFSEDP